MRPRPSSAGPSPVSSTRRACCSTSRAVGSSTSCSPPASPPRRASCTATTRASTSCGWGSRPACGASSSTASTNWTVSTRCTASDLPCRTFCCVTPGVHAHTHTYIATGQNDSKFGFNLANGDAERAARRAQASPSVNLVGFHSHIGSNVFVAESFAKAAAVMADFAAGFDLPELVLGVGSALPMSPTSRRRRRASGRPPCSTPAHRPVSRQTSASSRDARSSPVQPSRCTRSGRSSGSRTCARTSPSTAE